jgi:hypothetical protein
VLSSCLAISRSGRESVSPHVFSSGLLVFLGGSKVDLHASNERPYAVEEDKVRSDASLARSPGRKYGMLRKLRWSSVILPLLLLRARDEWEQEGGENRSWNLSWDWEERRQGRKFETQDY